MSDHGVSAETSDELRADTSYIEDGPHLAAETSRRIACDGSIFQIDEKARPQVNTSMPVSPG
jgi:hypothetical protein